MRLSSGIDGLSVLGYSTHGLGMDYITGFLTVSLFALPASGQTLPEFSRAVLAPLATKHTEDEAMQKRATLARACATAKPKDWGDLLGLFYPHIKDALTDVTPEQAHNFCRLALEILNDQTASKLAARVADLELRTTATDTDGGRVFAVCNEKTARTWKALTGGTFKESGDTPC